MSPCWACVTIGLFMKKISYLLVLCVFALCVGGCAHQSTSRWWSSWKLKIPFRKHTTSKIVGASAVVPEPGLLKSVRIVDQQRLQQGGAIAIIPFKPGQGIEADAHLDHVVLRMVKGASDVLLSSAEVASEDWDGQTQRFQVLTAADAHQADLILQGYITAIQKPFRHLRWMRPRPTVKLAFQAKLIDRTTGRVVAVFEDDRSMKKQKKSILADKELLKALAYKIGKDVGRVLLWGSNTQTNE